jgi:hypothetical protein
MVWREKLMVRKSTQNMWVTYSLTLKDRAGEPTLGKERISEGETYIEWVRVFVFLMRRHRLCRQSRMAVSMYQDQGAWRLNA